MKISKKPTNWLLVTVSKNGNFTALDFILIEFTPYYRSHLRKQLDVTKTIGHLHSFYTICFWDTPTGWFIYHEEGIEGHLENANLTWTFIEWEDDQEATTVKETYEPMEGEYLALFASGTAQFHGTPKHLTSELDSDEFPLESILNMLANEFGES